MTTETQQLAEKFGLKEYGDQSYFTGKEWIDDIKWITTKEQLAALIAHVRQEAREDEDYRNQVKAEALEEAATWFDSHDYIWSNADNMEDYAENQLRRMASELRSEKKGGL